MMPHEIGTTIPLSLPRRLVGDLLHFAQRIPSVTVQRVMNLSPLCEARSRATPRISWSMLFVKGYARVAAQFPQLRRAYLPFPTARLYEHPFSIASVAIEREFLSEKGVFFAHFRHPETQTLAQLDESLRRYKEAPLEEIGLFRRALMVSGLPRPLRRLLWWIGLNSSGPKRARRMGTFGLSVYSSLGAESLNLLSPLTTTINYGVIGADGRVPVRIIYDHRVMDGATVARALASLEQTLNNDLRAELVGAASARAA
jgi:pyruvate/2-oxoglutarate dehydrogenase complex dihydrolipoamide acyltransferase (E2) component